MILTCENCLKRYLVSDRSVGDSGRQVRCVSCGHEWFQEPPSISLEEMTARAEAEHIDLEPIPESVRPLPEGSGVPALLEEGNPVPPISGGRGTGYIAAVAVFFIILAGLLVMREPLSASWPPIAALYTGLGLPASLPGDGLSIDDVQAATAPNAQGLNVLTIHGHIVNHRSTAVKLPPLEAQVHLDSEKVFDHWQIELTQRTIAAHQSLDFATSYPAAPKNAKNIAVRFLIP